MYMARQNCRGNVTVSGCGGGGGLGDWDLLKKKCMGPLQNKMCMCIFIYLFYPFVLMGISAERLNCLRLI